jgi:D-glycero-D-manno-heptose 1,7-bisphosphate phosphatase
MYKLAILDRDGVINKPSLSYIKSVDEWQPLPGSIEAIARLTKAGIRVAIATNQSAIARGLLDVGELNAMHKKMNRAAERAGGRIDAIFFCPHLPSNNCDCRKPKPGMMLNILNRFRVSAADTFMIGDHDRDVQAAQAAGVKPFLVLTGQKLDKKAEAKVGVPTFNNLAAVVQHVLEGSE